MNRHHIIPHDEAEWTGPGRVWAHVQQYPPRSAVPPVGAVLKVGAAFVLGVAACFMIVVALGAFS